MLYLEGNHTLFGEKLYFIWKFTSGNTVAVSDINFKFRLAHGGITISNGIK